MKEKTAQNNKKEQTKPQGEIQSIFYATFNVCTTCRNATWRQAWIGRRNNPPWKCVVSFICGSPSSTRSNWASVGPVATTHLWAEVTVRVCISVRVWDSGCVYRGAATPHLWAEVREGMISSSKSSSWPPLSPICISSFALALIHVYLSLETKPGLKLIVTEAKKNSIETDHA